MVSNNFLTGGEKTTMFKVLALFVALTAASAPLNASAKTDTLDGTLVSASCYLSDNSATGNDMGGIKQCGTGCLQQGKPAGLLTKDKDFYILDVPSLAIAPYVGQEIRVTGEEHGKDILSVKTVAVRKGGGWESIDIKYHPKQ
jgi:hypothetical protein